MTWLEHVCEQLMGPPIARSGDRSIWPCPECGDQTAFSTLPPKHPYKDRVYCHRCDFGGDEADIVKFFHPEEGGPKRREMIAAWRRDYNQGILQTSDDTGSGSGTETY
jgi:hypothetical protein